MPQNKKVEALSLLVDGSNCMVEEFNRKQMFCKRCENRGFVKCSTANCFMKLLLNKRDYLEGQIL